MCNFPKSFWVQNSQNINLRSSYYQPKALPPTDLPPQKWYLFWRVTRPVFAHIATWRRTGIQDLRGSRVCEGVLSSHPTKLVFKSWCKYGLIIITKYKFFWHVMTCYYVPMFNNKMSPLGKSRVTNDNNFVDVEANKSEFTTLFKD